jgi:hypothetical protein
VPVTREAPGLARKTTPAESFLVIGFLRSRIRCAVGYVVRRGI